MSTWSTARPVSEQKRHASVVQLLQFQQDLIFSSLGSPIRNCPAVTGRLENKLVHHRLSLSVITSLTSDRFLTNVSNVSYVISCCVIIYIIGVYAG